MGVERAFLGSTGPTTDLNALLAPGSGWDLDYASGINDRGRIIGCGRFLGRRRPFLLDLQRQSQVRGTAERRVHPNHGL
ncbi:MAG TPA: hypothetical protein VIL85_25035 [Thermomicrobiales bacterium]